LASRPGEFHPRALPEPCVNLSIHTAPDVQPLAHTSNGLASSPELLPLPVGPEPRLNNAAPSVQPHYRTFIPTTNCSAPALRIGTLVLVGSSHSDFSLGIGAAGSHVPHESLNHSHAAFMPDAAWAVDRSPPRLIPG